MLLSFSLSNPAIYIHNIYYTYTDILFETVYYSILYCSVFKTIVLLTNNNPCPHSNRTQLALSQTLTFSLILPLSRDPAEGKKCDWRVFQAILSTSVPFFLATAYSLLAFLLSVQKVSSDLRIFSIQ